MAYISLPWCCTHKNPPLYMRKILRGPYQNFWILPLMEVFRHVYMTNYSYSYYWKREVLWPFIYALTLMVHGWFYLSSFDPMSYLVVGFAYFECILMVCSFFISLELPLTLQKSTKWFIIVYPFHPSKGCDFWPL